MNTRTQQAALAGLVLFVVLIIAIGLHYYTTNAAQTPSLVAGNFKEESLEDIRFGINLSDFKVLNHVVKPGEIFSEILGKYNVAYQTIHFLAKESEDIFSIRKIKAGNQCTVLCEQTQNGLVPKKMIYEASKVDFVVFNLDDSLYIYRGQNKVQRVQREVSGVINSSLYETLEQNDISPALAVRMAEIFAWSIDFYKIQQGDKFKVVYDEDFSGDESVGIGEIKAVLFNSGGKDYYAFYFAKDAAHEGDYYDQDGNSMKKQFLKSPVKFSHISSKFSMKRFHPVTKRWKAHLGTDYAAPHGTPILATADGVVEEAQFKSANGNYVKIRHNGEYKTQYLHMSKIAKGMKRGTRVKQGEVIGYVGSTGLATGPHVCYRFWKDGQQVDPLRQKLSFSDPLPAPYKKQFMSATAAVRSTLEHITYSEHNIAVQKQKKQDMELLQAKVLADIRQAF
ncbi:MAG: peptidoglycan DD-metalloendopeptidase family protein [Bacteroidetes bacterium]|nr:peptidoglycan DD-metalloendopeptidase family protein [Bacteroidota bacterium]